MTITHPRIYLASQSPRRRELLKQIGISFDPLLFRADPHRSIDVDETPLANETPEAYVRRVCAAKVRMGWQVLTLRSLPDCPILAADTTVTLDGKILGKPFDREEAASMLRQLSGRSHQVLTAVAMAFGDRVEVSLSSTTVTFAELGEERIHHYVMTGEPHDKAGAYAIQGHAASFVQSISGSYSGVVGLPLYETTELLKSFGYPVL